MTVIARTPICGDCTASLDVDREGSCEAPGCSGHVSWEAAFDALADQLRGAVKALEAAQAVMRREMRADDRMELPFNEDMADALKLVDQALGGSRR